MNDPGTNAALTGNPRIITITNTGSDVALNVAYSLSPALPSGTTIAPATCGTVAPAATCLLTVTPGATASAAPGDTNPTAVTLSIAGDNTNTLTPHISVLTYGSVYQGGYVFAFNDTTPTTGSVGGEVAALTDQAPISPNGIIWASNGTDGTFPSTVFDDIPGIYETSIAPPCNGATDGTCNTQQIVDFYSPPTTSPAINPSFYAAGLCKATIAGYSDWHLPAICEMGYDVGGIAPQCGISSSPTLQNMQSNLVERNGGIGSLSGDYWASTEFSVDPMNLAFIQRFGTGGVQLIGSNPKFFLNAVRCARMLTQ